MEQLSLLHEKRDGATIHGYRRMKARPTVRKPRTMGHPSGGVLGLSSLRDESLAVMRVANTKTRTKHGAPGSRRALQRRPPPLQPLAPRGNGRTARPNQ
jgi:hypothetical protein